MNEKKMTVNPMWVLFLGACPALGATGTLRGAVSMGITVLAVMLLTALVTALLRRILPERAVIAATVLTAALFTSAAHSAFTGHASAEFTIVAGERVEALNRVTLEISCPGRPTPLLLSLPILG